jgi:hypothetical protein
MNYCRRLIELVKDITKFRCIYVLNSYVQTLIRKIKIFFVGEGVKKIVPVGDVPRRGILSQAKMQSLFDIARLPLSSPSSVRCQITRRLAPRAPTPQRRSVRISALPINGLDRSFQQSTAGIALPF